MIESSSSFFAPMDASQLELLEKRLKEQLITMEKNVAEFQETFEQFKADHDERSRRLQATYEDPSKKNEHYGKTVAESSPNAGSVLINSDGESNADDEINKSLQDNPIILELDAEVKSLQKRNEESKQITLSTKRDDIMEEEIKSLWVGFHEVTNLQASDSNCSATDSLKENSVTDGSSTADSTSNMEELRKSLQDDLDLEIALDCQISELAAKVDVLQKEHEQQRSNLQSAKKYTTLPIERDDNQEKDVKSFQEQLQTYHRNRATNDSAEITPSTGQCKSDEEIESLHERLDEEAHHQESDCNHSVNDSVDEKTVAERSPNTGSVLISSDGESNANDKINKSLQDDPIILELDAEVKSLQKRNEESKQTTLSTKRDHGMEEEIKRLQEGLHEETVLQVSDSNCSATDSLKENSVSDGSSTADSTSDMEELHKSLKDDLDLEIALDCQISELAAKVDLLQKEHEQQRSNLQSAKKYTTLPIERDDNQDKDIKSFQEQLQAYHSNRATNDSAEGKTVAESSPNTGSVLINSDGESSANDEINKSLQDNPIILELDAEVKSLQKRNEQSKQTTLSTKRDDTMEEEIKSLREGVYEVTDLQASDSNCSATDSVNENSVIDGSSTADSASNMKELQKSLQDDLALEIALDCQISELAAKVDLLQKEHEQQRSNPQSAKKYTTLPIERDDSQEKDVKSFQEQLQTYHRNRATNDSAEEKSVTESSPTSESVLNF